MVLINPNQSITVDKSNILYHCGWSPFEGQTFSHTVESTWVNGNLVWNNGKVYDQTRGQRLKFDR